MWVISSLAIQLLFFDNQVNLILVAKVIEVKLYFPMKIGK